MRRTDRHRRRGLTIGSLAACVLLLGACSSEQPDETRPIGYQHNAVDTLRVLVPVCDDEQVESADLRVESATDNLPGTGVDVPAKDGAVDFLIGYPGGTRARTDDLWLTVVTSRTTIDVHIPPEDPDDPRIGQWLASGTGEPTTPEELRELRSC